MKNQSTIKEIYQFLKPFLWKKLSRKLRIFFIFCFIFLIFAKLATLITPIILGKTIDSLSLLDSMQNIITPQSLKISLVSFFKNLDPDFE